MYKTLTSLVKFILNYFILFDAIVNGIVFLTSFSDNSSSVYGNAIDFCMLILCPATLLNLFISPNSFFVCSLQGFSYIRSCHVQTETNFPSSFPISMPFISFYGLIAVTRTFSTMLDRSGSGKSGHPCLVPDLRGKTFSFSLFSMMFSVMWACHIRPYYVEVISFYF